MRKMSRIWMASLMGQRKALLAELLWVVVSLGWDVWRLVVGLGMVVVGLEWFVVVFCGFVVGFGGAEVGLWVGVVTTCLVETCLMVTVPGEKKTKQHWHQNLFLVVSGHYRREAKVRECWDRSS